jgi:hypothetical protein
LWELVIRCKYYGAEKWLPARMLNH